MGALKIAVYTCMKNEYDNLNPWIASCWEADVCVVLDTGSTDGTRDRLREPFIETPPELMLLKPRMIVADALISPFRFDVALNSTLALVPPDVDICVQLSADERLEKGWRAKLEQAWEKHAAYWQIRGETPSEVFKVHYQYEFSPGFVFGHDRIHSRRGYVWRYPFHEGLYPAHGVNEQHVWTDLRISQVQSPAVNRMERDLALAEQARAEWPQDARMAFYVGRQLMYAGKWRAALKELQRYDHLVRQRGWEVPQEAEWCADAVRQCWAGIARDGDERKTT